jgi:hypothetical protein
MRQAGINIFIPKGIINITDRTRVRKRLQSFPIYVCKGLRNYLEQKFNTNYSDVRLDSTIFEGIVIFGIRENLKQCQL